MRMFPAPLAIIDTETTGMTATADRVTEIGILTVVDGKVVDEWSTLINPQCAIPGEIQALTGITDAMVRDAPSFYEVADLVHQRLAGHIFVAHNARFDYGFIKHELKRAGISFQADVLCTVRLSRRLYPQFRGHSLDALRERHQLSTEGRHRALGDARAAWQFIETAIAEHPAEEVARAVKVLLKMPSLPPQLAPGVLDDLPEGPGVYTFYGVNDLPIYIGKSKNLRDRIRSHFSSDYRSANDQRLSTEITRIEFEETAGELGALLRESELIKSKMPLRNHRLRRNQEASFVRLQDLNQPPQFLNMADVDYTDLTGLYGPFPSKGQARDSLLSLAAEHGLCWNVLKNEKHKGPCFAHQLHRCRGYCTGKESLLQHNLRLLTAIAGYRFGDWPYDGPLGICETHPEHGWQRLHVFDHWLYLGTVASEDEWYELQSARSAQEFDPDMYKILNKYLAAEGAFVVLRRAASPSPRLLAA